MKELEAFVLNSPVSASELGPDPTAYVYGLKADAITQTITQDGRHFTKEEWNTFWFNDACSFAAEMGNHTSIDAIERRVREIRKEIDEMKPIINRMFSLDPVAV